MNKNEIIFDSLSGEKKINFLLSCYAKQKGWFGVPRLILDEDTDFYSFFQKPITHYQLCDSKFFNIIDNDDLNSFLDHSNKFVIFDFAQLSFDQEDHFFKYLNDRTKKIFNLYERDLERQKFIRTNHEHYKNPNTIVTQIIKNKLNDVWKSKWGSSESYLDRQNIFLDNIVSE